MKFLLLFSSFIFSTIAVSQSFDEIRSFNTCNHSDFFIKQLSGFNNYNQTPLLNDYDVTFYFLDVNVENNSTYISGKVRIDAYSLASPLDTFAVELISDLTVDSIIFNNHLYSFLHINDGIFVPLDSTVDSNSLFTATIYYHGQPPSGGFFTGISTGYSEDYDKHSTWTLSEPFNARQWWPTKQVLDDKADSSWVFITTDSTNKAGSQGLLTNTVALNNGKVRYEWKSRYPIEYYLISVSVADYQEYNIYAKPSELAGDSILIQNYIYDSPGCLGSNREAIDRTATFLELFSELYSLYPFYKEKYGHCMSQIGGGMEHQTMSTIGEFGFGIVAHELGHMWFGDNVTCATWSDIWINEGFATYSDYLAHEFVAGGEWPEIWMDEVHDYVMSDSGGSIYIPPEEINPENVWRIFDGRLSYYKGACIIHMIRFELQNDDLFWKVLHNFQKEFAGSVATGLDFMEVLNKTSQSDFSYFFDQWYFGEGYPIYNITFDQDSTFFTMNVHQSTSTDITKLFKMLMEYKLVFNDNTDTSVFLYQNSNHDTFFIPLKKDVSTLVVDPDNWVLNEAGNISGIPEEPQSSFDVKISPNPARSKINIHLNNSGIGSFKILIISSSGKVISRYNCSEKYTGIDISYLKNGIYYLLIKAGKFSASEKFIKI